MIIVHSMTKIVLALSLIQQNILTTLHAATLYFVIVSWSLTTVKGGTPGTEIGGLLGNVGGGTVKKKENTLHLLTTYKSTNLTANK